MSLPVIALPRDASTKSFTLRDARLRLLYLQHGLHDIPRLLGAIDRNPQRATYGCLDREYWHYRTRDFPSEMFQEGAWPLAFVFTHALPGNRWHQQPRVRELSIAALRFAARSCHRDGSCDDYYPFERALGAAVFSFQAATATCAALGLDDAEIFAWLERRGRWLLRHDETGRLANHQALAAVGLQRAADLLGRDDFARGAALRIEKVLAWQSSEGWFDEYGGADPGYQTVTLEALANYQRLTRDAALAGPLARGVAFARMFLHPDGSYAGDYGSRGTAHFSPHGMELLAPRLRAAGELADGFLRALRDGRAAVFADDRLFAHRTASYLEAFVDWSPELPEQEERSEKSDLTYFAEAQLLVRCDDQAQTIVSAARGGSLKHFAGPQVHTESGWLLATTTGRHATTQLHDRSRDVEVVEHPEPGVRARLTVSGRFHEVRFETATPWKLIVFRLLLLVLGRWCRGLVRALLQRRLITGRRPFPARWTRIVDLLARGGLRVRDTLTLEDPRLQIQRLSLASDLQTAYVAASQIYQESVLENWTDFSEAISSWNQRREIAFDRSWPKV